MVMSDIMLVFPCGQEFTLLGFLWVQSWRQRNKAEYHSDRVAVKQVTEASVLWTFYNLI